MTHEHTTNATAMDLRGDCFGPNGMTFHNYHLGTATIFTNATWEGIGSPGAHEAKRITERARKKQ